MDKVIETGRRLVIVGGYEKRGAGSNSIMGFYWGVMKMF